MSSLKLELTTDDVFKILAGEDGKVSLEIKNWVIQEFTNHYLKGIANEELMKQAVDKTRDLVAAAVNQVVEQEVGKRSWNNFTFTKEFSDKLRSTVNEAAHVLVQQAIENAIDPIALESLVRIQVQRRVEKMLPTLITDEFKAVLAKNISQAG